jgi:hypothetical protein
MWYGDLAISGMFLYEFSCRMWRKRLKNFNHLTGVYGLEKM